MVSLKHLIYIRCYLYLNNAPRHKILSNLSHWGQNMINTYDSVLLNSKRLVTIKTNG